MVQFEDNSCPKGFEPYTALNIKSCDLKCNIEAKCKPLKMYKR
jgi:hypothetical protein